MPLIKCFECGKEISDKALSCPYCGAPLSAKVDKTTLSIKRKNATQSNTEVKHNEAFAVIGFAIILLIVIVILIRSCSGGSDTVSEDIVTPDKFSAHFIAKEMIKGMLKDPEGAEFPSITDIQITNLGNGTWTVLGYVDGKNGFGATQRVKYKVEMHAKEQCNDYQAFQCWDDVKPYMEE